MKQGLQRRLATGTNAVLVGLFVVATVVLLVDLAGRFRLRTDLSEDGVATLQQDTLAALRQADQAAAAVQIIATSHQRRNAEATYKDRRVRDLLRELELNSVGVVTTWVDLDRDRQLAEAYEISNYGTIVVRHGEQRVDFKERDVFRRLQGEATGGQPNLDFRGEALIARGVQQVLSGRSLKIYLMKGHGEASMTDSGPEGLQRLTDTLDRQGWDVDALDLLRDRDVAGTIEVPADAAALLVVAPQANLDPTEVEAVVGYLRRGGAVGVWLEPGRPVPGFLAGLGVSVPDGVAYDRPSVAPFDDWWLPRYGRHPIVDELSAEDIKTIFARGAAVRAGRREGVDVVPLLSTSRGGWLERVPERPPADFDADLDEMGPVDVALALNVLPSSSLVDRSARVVVVGDASMVGNEQMDRLGNPTFAVNAVRWIVREEDRMSLVGRPGRLRSVTMSPEAANRIGWLVIGAWPLLVVLLGGLVWWTRRAR